MIEGDHIQHNDCLLYVDDNECLDHLYDIGTKVKVKYAWNLSYS